MRPYHWVGHALVDMGIATIMAAFDLERPEDIREEHLEPLGDECFDAFFSPGGEKKSTVLYTTNFTSTHPAYSPERRRAETRKLLHLFDVATEDRDPMCCFCGRPAQAAPSRDGLELGGMRHRVPLLAGRDAINFEPYGRAGRPVCGECLFAVLALELSAPFVRGKAVVADAEDRGLLVAIVREWLLYGREWLALARTSPKVPPMPGRPLGNIVHTLARVARLLRREGSGTVTVLHLSNSGQGPDLTFYRVGDGVVRFIMRAQRAAVAAEWAALVRRGWRAKEPREADPDARWVGDNRYYEAVGRLPESFPAWLRVHVLGLAMAPDCDPSLCLWPLVELALEEVMRMDKARIQAIASLGDNVAQMLVADNDRRGFGRLFRARGYRQYRDLLLRMSMRAVREGRDPVVDFDRFVKVFEAEDMPGESAQRLAWDLMLVRVLDRLHEARWLSPEVVEEVAELEEEESELAREEGA